MIDGEVKRVIFYIADLCNSILNGLSAIMALCVVVVIVCAMAINLKTMNRVSIRITLAIAVMDIFKALHHVIFYALELEGVSCVLADFVYNFVTLAYLFLNMSLAVNLHLVFLAEHTFNPLWERAYWCVSFGVATLLSLVAPVGYLLGQADMTNCMDGDPNILHLWEWGYFFFWILATAGYCFVVVSLTILKLNRNKETLIQALTESGKRHSWQAERYRTIITSLIRRIAFYCFIPVVTYAGYIVFEVDERIEGAPRGTLLVVSTITMGLPGILNCLAFLADPAFRQALRAFRLYFAARHSWDAKSINESASIHTRASQDTHECTLFNPAVPAQRSPEEAIPTIGELPASRHVSMASANHVLYGPRESTLSEEGRYKRYIRSL